MAASPSPSPDALVKELRKRSGQTYAAETGIRLTDSPAALYQLLVLRETGVRPVLAGHGRNVPSL